MLEDIAEALCISADWLSGKTDDEPESDYTVREPASSYSNGARSTAQGNVSGALAKLSDEELIFLFRSIAGKTDASPDEKRLAIRIAIDLETRNPTPA